MLQILLQIAICTKPNFEMLGGNQEERYGTVYFKSNVEYSGKIQEKTCFDFKS